MAVITCRITIDGRAGKLMKFLVHAEVNEANIGERLGTADYSYFFLLRSFSQVFADLGEVVTVQDPAEAEAIHAQGLAAGEQCVLLSFAPPHKTPLGLTCPVVPVFAWEYPDIPERLEEVCWQDDPRNDWRHVFSRTSKAIALSRHTMDAVKRAMGPHFPIAAIPSPLRAAEHTDHGQIDPVTGSAVLRIEASVADSRQMGLNADQLLSLEEEDGTPYQLGDDDVLPPLPHTHPSLDHKVEILDTEVLELLPGESGPVVCGWDIPPVMPIAIQLRGLIYTSVLTPAVGRKNWEDLVTAFCWTFRNRADVTLILKLTGSDLPFSHCQLLMLLTKLSPMRCRVISVYGYLSDTDYASLIDVTTYYVNASLCEGLCLPLIEFLNSGIPAIAPDNTGMADYIDDKLAFVVESYPGEPTVWPHGDYEVNRTTRHQVSWASLADAYLQSYRVALDDPERYRRMSTQASCAIQAYCGVPAVKRMLQDFLLPGHQPEHAQPQPSHEATADAIRGRP